MTKVCTHGRDASVGLIQLEESLRRLQTDHLDLWQIHVITYDNDPDLAYRKGGVIEALDRAKQQGKVRYVGFAVTPSTPSTVRPMRSTRNSAAFKRSCCPTRCSAAWRCWA